jgi:hypothetical protein
MRGAWAILGGARNLGCRRLIESHPDPVMPPQQNQPESDRLLEAGH